VQPQRQQQSSQPAQDSDASIAVCVVEGLFASVCIITTDALQFQHLVVCSLAAFRRRCTRWVGWPGLAIGAVGGIAYVSRLAATHRAELQWTLHTSLMCACAGTNVFARVRYVQSHILRLGCHKEARHALQRLTATSNCNSFVPSVSESKLACTSLSLETLHGRVQHSVYMRAKTRDVNDVGTNITAANSQNCCQPSYSLYYRPRRLAAYCSTPVHPPSAASLGGSVGLLNPSQQGRDQWCPERQECPLSKDACCPVRLNKQRAQQDKK